MAGVRSERDGAILVVTIDRPERRNAVDGATARALAGAFRAFDLDPELSVAVLAGAGEHFCAGADLKALAEGDVHDLAIDGDGPMGPTRMRLGKPVIAAIEGYCVAGGLELALWCDLRVAARDAVLGVFNRRFGVPLIDLGTVRLARITGQGLAMDMILTGRAVSAEEGQLHGLVNRVVERGRALEAALEVARSLAAFPQAAMRNDRLSLLDQWGLDEDAAMRSELEHGMETLASGEGEAGARRFAEGASRGGES
jgi:enoyl-CoA hydratase